jgi:hypothetical protein
MTGTALPHFIQNTDELRTLLTTLPAPRAEPCPCNSATYISWESMADDRWPAALMEQVATLRDPDVEEPTFEEQHPNGTRYDSPDAPIALKFFPFNRCAMWHCTQCHRNLLRYTEYGGYYIDHRVRLFQSELLLG